MLTGVGAHIPPQVQEEANGQGRRTSKSVITIFACYMNISIEYEILVSFKCACLSNEFQSASAKFKLFFIPEFSPTAFNLDDKKVRYDNCSLLLSRPYTGIINGLKELGDYCYFANTPILSRGKIAKSL
jgi:hypothetical protein